MIIPDDKKRVLASILTIKAKPDEATQAKPDDSDKNKPSDEMTVIAEDILEAIKKGSPEDLASALHAFAQEIESQDEDEDKEDDSDDEDDKQA